MAARSAFRSFASLRKLVLVVVGLVVVLFILRTPTAPYYNPGRPHPPPPPPGGIDGNKFPRRRLPESLQDYLTWKAPDDQPEHYPPYTEYTNRDYDPNLWESFEQCVVAVTSTPTLISQS